MSSADVPGELDGRVILVTGAARGQGRAIAERLRAAGARLVVGDVLDSVHDQAGDAVVTATLDVTDAASWSAAVDAGAERFGHLDGLVNNAGILHRMPLADETAEQFEHVWRVNCLGAFLGVRAVLPHLRDGAAVVNTLSTAALTAWTDHGAYASSKWALRGLTKVLALELAERGIRVNAIVPGPILTPMVLRDDDPGAAERLSRTPLGRAGEPADVAELALFLVGERSAFITGAEFVIDGGQTAGIVLPRPQTLSPIDHGVRP